MVSSTPWMRRRLVHEQARPGHQAAALSVEPYQGPQASLRLTPPWLPARPPHCLRTGSPARQGFAQSPAQGRAHGGSDCLLEEWAWRARRPSPGLWTDPAWTAPLAERS